MLELVCSVGLIVPAVVHWQPMLTVVAAAILATESLVFIGAHVTNREIPPIIISAVLYIIGVDDGLCHSKPMISSARNVFTSKSMVSLFRFASGPPNAPFQTETPFTTTCG